jgi:hypothetical protein
VRGRHQAGSSRSEQAPQAHSCARPRGGIRGILTLQFLQAVETLEKTRFCDYFDLIGHLADLGRRAAAKQVKPEHLPAAFDLAKTAAYGVSPVAVGRAEVLRIVGPGTAADHRMKASP